MQGVRGWSSVVRTKNYYGAIDFLMLGLILNESGRLIKWMLLEGVGVQNCWKA